MPHDLPETLRLEQLAFLLGGISTARVSQLCNEAIVEKVGHNAYAIGSIPTYVRRLRERGDRSSDGRGPNWRGSVPPQRGWRARSANANYCLLTK